MATPSDVLEIAASQIGYSRWTDPQAGTKYGRWYAEVTHEPYYAQNGVPYCAMFVSWVLAQAKQACAGFPGAYCPTMLQAARRAGLAVAYKDARPGDIVFFDWDGGETDHVGIVELNKGSYYQTIEGNTSSGTSGSQGNGGVVARRTRALSVVCGVVRPPYTTSSDGAPVEVTTLAVDGVIGPESVKGWQRAMKTPVDGVVSGQLEEYADAYPQLKTVEFGGGGSSLMRAVQNVVGVPDPTGVIYHHTISLLQAWLVGMGHNLEGARVGELDTITAMAVQRSINDKAW